MKKVEQWAGEAELLLILLQRIQNLNSTIFINHSIPNRKQRKKRITRRRKRWSMMERLELGREGEKLEFTWMMERKREKSSNLKKTWENSQKFEIVMFYDISKTSGLSGIKSHWKKVPNDFKWNWAKNESCLKFDLFSNESKIIEWFHHHRLS